MARLIRSRDLPEGKARSPGSAAPTVAGAAPRLRTIDHAPSPVGAGGAWPVVPSAVMHQPKLVAKGAPGSPPVGRASRSGLASGHPVCSGRSLRASTSAAHSSVARWPSDPGPMKPDPSRGSCHNRLGGLCEASCRSDERCCLAGQRRAWPRTLSRSILFTTTRTRATLPSFAGACHHRRRACAPNRGVEPLSLILRVSAVHSRPVGFPSRPVCSPVKPASVWPRLLPPTVRPSARPY
jgi:hypothetical protein